MVYFDLHSKLLTCEEDVRVFSDILEMPIYRNLPASEFKQKMRSFMLNLYHRRKQAEEQWLQAFPKDYSDFLLLSETQAEDFLHIILVCPRRMHGLELSIFDIFQAAWNQGKHDFYLVKFTRVFKCEAFIEALLQDCEICSDKIAWMIGIVQHEPEISLVKPKLLDVLKAWRKAFDVDTREKIHEFVGLIDPVLF